MTDLVFLIDVPGFGRCGGRAAAASHNAGIVVPAARKERQTRLSAKSQNSGGAVRCYADIPVVALATRLNGIVEPLAWVAAHVARHSIRGVSRVQAFHVVIAPVRVEATDDVGGSALASGDIPGEPPFAARVQGALDVVTFLHVHRSVAIVQALS